MTPSQKTLGKWRKKAFQVGIKITFMKVALYSPNVQVSEAAGQIALAINLTVPSSVQGAISSAFMQQMKTCLSALMREAKSTLVSNLIDAWLMVNHTTCPPRVSRVHEDMYAERKALHMREFVNMLECPGGFSISDYPNMHSFHGIVGADGQMVAFGNPKWLEFVAQFLLRIPSGGRRLTLHNLSFIFLGLKARLTFTPSSTGSAPEYGELSERIYTQRMHRLQRSND